MSEGVRSEHHDVSSLHRSAVEHSVDDGTNELQERKSSVRNELWEGTSSVRWSQTTMEERRRAYGNTELNVGKRKAKISSQHESRVEGKSELTTSDIEYSRGASTSYLSPPWLVGNRLRKDRSNGSPSPVTFEIQKMGHKLEGEVKEKVESARRVVKKGKRRLECGTDRSLTKS